MFLVQSSGRLYIPSSYRESRNRQVSFRSNAIVRALIIPGLDDFASFVFLRINLGGHIKSKDCVRRSALYKFDVHFEV